MEGRPDKEKFRNFDTLINWGKYAEALDEYGAYMENLCELYKKENNRQKIALKAYEILFEQATNEINKLKEALKDCCGKASCAYMKIEDEYCSHENGVEHCSECLFNHYMKGMDNNG